MASARCPSRNRRHVLRGKGRRSSCLCKHAVVLGPHCRWRGYLRRGRAHLLGVGLETVLEAGPLHIPEHALHRVDQGPLIRATGLSGECVRNSQDVKVDKCLLETVAGIAGFIPQGRRDTMGWQPLHLDATSHFHANQRERECVVERIIVCRFPTILMATPLRRHINIARTSSVASFLQDLANFMRTAEIRLSQQSPTADEEDQRTLCGIPLGKLLGGLPPSGYVLWHPV
mmetsp:Transcript_132351/g.330027  ORF Transcript_132351/g.330027 Transcript_132351/m.330027 type:complete len:230 (+) Transcript_132351:261-950(+)